MRRGLNNQLIIYCLVLAVAILLPTSCYHYSSSSSSTRDMSIYQGLYRRAAQLFFAPASIPRATFQSRSSTATTTTTTRLFSHTSSTNMAANSDPKTQQEASSSTENSTTNADSSPLALPPAEEDAQKLDVSGSGSSVKLDHLGPLVVNRDGTLSRIANWDKMTEIEKKNTLRILGKRNQLRRDALNAANNEGEKAE